MHRYTLCSLFFSVKTMNDSKFCMIRTCLIIMLFFYIMVLQTGILFILFYFMVFCLNTPYIRNNWIHVRIETLKYQQQFTQYISWESGTFHIPHNRLSENALVFTCFHRLSHNSHNPSTLDCFKVSQKKVLSSRDYRLHGILGKPPQRQP